MSIVVIDILMFIVSICFNAHFVAETADFLHLQAGELHLTQQRPAGRFIATFLSASPSH
jgi:hypothetical protein